MIILTIHIDNVLQMLFSVTIKMVAFFSAHAFIINLLHLKKNTAGGSYYGLLSTQPLPLLYTSQPSPPPVPMITGWVYISREILLTASVTKNNYC